MYMFSTRLSLKLRKIDEVWNTRFEFAVANTRCVWNHHTIERFSSTRSIVEWRFVVRNLNWLLSHLNFRSIIKVGNWLNLLSRT